MSEMEKVFGIGDRVYHERFGLGTVVEKGAFNYLGFLVKYDKEDTHLHDGRGVTTYKNCEGKCWWSSRLIPYNALFGGGHWKIGKSFIFNESSKIPHYIGYKNGVTTLVWYDGSKTKAKAKDNENIDYLYGFLIAYYKKIKGYKSGKMGRHLQEVLYPYTFDFQVGYLMSVFRENCGLSVRKQEQFLDLYTQPTLPFEKDESSEVSVTFKVDVKFL